MLVKRLGAIRPGMFTSILPQGDIDWRTWTCKYNTIITSVLLADGG